MTDRENLITLIWHKQDCGLTHNGTGQDFVTYNADLADHLIANGVVVQRWIPVTERLPDTNTAVIAFDAAVGIVFQCLYAYDGWDLWEGNEVNITHWMPLPEPPKEGE